MKLPRLMDTRNHSLENRLLCSHSYGANAIDSTQDIGGMADDDNSNMDHTDNVNSDQCQWKA